VGDPAWNGRGPVADRVSSVACGQPAGWQAAVATDQYRVRVRHAGFSSVCGALCLWASEKWTGVRVEAAARAAEGWLRREVSERRKPREPRAFVQSVLTSTSFVKRVATQKPSHSISNNNKR
jgi:hypothetical protein